MVDGKPLLVALTAVSSTVYFHMMFFMLCRMFGEKQCRRPVWMFVASIADTMWVLYASGRQLLLPVVHLALLAFVFLELRLLCGKKVGHAAVYWGALHVVYYRLILMSIVSALFALATRDSLYALLLQQRYHVGILCTASMLLTALQLLKFFVFPIRQMDSFVQTKTETVFVSKLGTVLFAYQCICSVAYYHEQNRKWFIVLFLLSCILMLSVYIAVLLRAVQVSVWTRRIDERFVLVERLEKQLLHYNAYKKYVESARAFRHDYIHVAEKIRALLRDGRRSQATQLLEQMDVKMQENICYHRRYSNHILVDAAMMELANYCLEHKIQFSANIFIPEWFALSDLESGKIFSVLSENAAEACVRLTGDAPRRWIRFKSGVENGWLIITAENSYDGVLLWEDNGLLRSRKDRAVLHGGGLQMLRETVEQRGGFLVVDTDSAPQVFKIALHFSCSGQEAQT